MVTFLPQFRPFLKPWTQGGSKNPSRWDDWGTRPPVPPFNKFRKDEFRWADQYFGPQYYKKRFTSTWRNPAGRWNQPSRPRFAPSARGTRKTPRYNILKCWRCGRLGHIARNCYAKTYIT